MMVNEKSADQMWIYENLCVNLSVCKHIVNNNSVN